MKYDLVTSKTQMQAIFKEMVREADADPDRFQKTAVANFYVTNVNLAKEIYEKRKPYGKFEFEADTRLKFKTDKAQPKLMWYCSAYVDRKEGSDNMEPHISEFNSTPNTLILYKGILFRPSFWNSKTTAEFYIFNDETNYNVIRPDAVLPVPNRMGTVTEKGMEAWYQYLTKRQKLAQETQDGKDAKWQEFLSDVRKIAESYGLEGDDAKNRFGQFYYKERDMRGFIDVNAIEMKFSYDKQSGHIYREIKLQMYSKDYDMLEKFRRLSHNDWNK